MEARFWKEILEDHLTFISERLASTEKIHLDTAKKLKDLLSRQEFSIKLVDRIISFKAKLLKDMVEGRVKLAMKPTFLKHMINEANEAILSLEGVDTTDLEQHKLWLLDIKGHLDAIQSELDSVECSIRKIAHKKKEVFGKLFSKALEFSSYVQSGVLEFSALERLTQEAEIETVAYLALVEELRDMRKDNTVLGLITPELLDHMCREQYYYLWKLGYSVDSSKFLK